jgi:hypothetical protein
VDTVIQYLNSAASSAGSCGETWRTSGDVTQPVESPPHQQQHVVSDPVSNELAEVAAELTQQLLPANNDGNAQDAVSSIEKATTMPHFEPAKHKTVQITSVNAGYYPCYVSSDHHSAEVRFANMFVGEQRDVLVQLSIPSHRMPKTSGINMDCSSTVNYPILAASAVYFSMDGVLMSAIAEGSDMASRATTPAVSRAATPAGSPRSPQPRQLTPAQLASSSPHSPESPSGNALEEGVVCVIQRTSVRTPTHFFAGGSMSPKLEHAQPQHTRNIEVDVQVNRCAVSLALEQALALADQVGTLWRSECVLYSLACVYLELCVY